MNQIKSATLALMLVVSASFAADSEYILTNDWPIQNPQNTIGIDGRLWVGNFGTNGGTLLSKSQVLSSDWFTLFAKFRPNTSFGLTGGLLDGLTLGEKTGLFNVGTGINYTDEGGIQGYTPDNATQFAGQDLYLFAINSAATSWNSTLLGSNYEVLLLGMSSGFGDGDPSTGLLAYDISGAVNDVVIGTGGSDYVNTASVPEPATGSLLLLAIGTALAVRRRKA